MFDTHNRCSAFAALLVGGAVFTVAACDDVTEAAPDFLVPIRIAALPDRDTISLNDSLILTVESAFGAATFVQWTIEPRGDSATGTTLLYRPQRAGKEYVRAYAEFAGRVGSAVRAIETLANHSPVGDVVELNGEHFRSVPVGDTIELVAEFEDPDGDSLAYSWYAAEPGGYRLLGSTDTLRLAVESVGQLDLVVEVSDGISGPSGAVYTAEAYDPLTPWVWRRRIGLPIVSLGPDSILYFTHVTSSARRLAAATTLGEILWEKPTSRSGPTLVVAGTSVHVWSPGDSLVRFSRTGDTEWVLHDVVRAPNVLAGGDLVVPSRTPEGGFGLRRVSASGTVVWNAALDSLNRIAASAVGSDGTTYVVGQSSTAWTAPTVVAAVRSDGSVAWQRTHATGFGLKILVADDSTIVLYGRSMLAFRPDGSVRWRRADLTRTPYLVVGTDDGAYLFDRTSLRALDLSDGAERWLVPAPMGGEPLLTSDGQVIGISTRYVVSWDAQTGQERWRHRLAYSANSVPLMTDDGLVIIFDYIGYAEALRVGGGLLNSTWPAAFADPQRSGRVRTP